MKAKDKVKMKKKKRPGKPNPKAKISDEQMADMTVDDMFTMINNDDGDLSDDEATLSRKHIKKKKKKQKQQTQKMNDQNKDPDEEDLGLDDDDDLADVGKLSRKEYLEQLKKNDPQFYTTMMQASDVMDLRSSSDEDEQEEDPERGGAIFTPPDEFEVDSEESDAEDETLEKRGHNIITAAMVAQWEQQLSQAHPHSAFLDANQALLAAIESLGSQDKDGVSKSKYRVEGPQIFNAIVRMCLKRVPDALLSILNVKSSLDNPTQTKRWSKHKGSINSYLRHLVMLTECVAEPSAAEAILSRGIRPLLPYYAALTSTCKLLVRRLVTLWATSEKRVRVVAFICIFRLARTLKGEFLEWVLKRLYLAYVQNSRFTSPSTWGMIDFMRLSLVELYALDQTLAYKHAFVYIRQMAFHLRNAITVKKKERMQMVYNWQYIHCLHLWADLLSKTHPSTELQPIIYPLTQVAIGTMKLQPTPAYYPLVFHVCNILSELSRHTQTFIPVLPFLLEILNKAPLNKKHLKASIRPFNWLCMLRLSQAEMTQSAFKDGIIDQVYNSIVTYLSVESASIAFPELVVSATMQLKAFLKSCRVPNYTKKIKQLLDKIKENKDFIEAKRKDVSFRIADTDAVKNWEIAVKQSGTPLAKHYENWKKVWEKEHLRKISNRVEMDDYNLPTVKRRELLEKQKAKDKDKIKEMFPSDDDESDDDDETRFLTKSERAKERKKEKKRKKNEEDDDSDAFGDDDDAFDDDDDGDDSDTDGPPVKKHKGAVNDGDENDDGVDNESDISDDGAADDVTEMNLSDLE